VISKKLALAATVVSTIALSLALSSPAAATTPQRTLPAEDQLFAFPADNIQSPILRSVQTSDSSWTDVGVSHTFDNVHEVTGAAYDPITHDSYFIGSSDGDWFDLIRVSTTDGTMTKIGEFPVSFWHPGVLITNTGVAYVHSGGALFPLDLSDATYGPQIGTGSGIGDEASVYAAACSPVAPTCYVIGQDNYENDSVVAPFDVATGTVGTPLGTLPVTNTLSIQVDSHGILWASTNNNHLASFDPADPASSYVEGPAFPPGTPLWIPGITPRLLLTTTAQTPLPPAEAAAEPSLPNTGSTVWMTGLATLAASTLFLIGFGMFAARSRLKFAGNRSLLISLVRDAHARLGSAEKSQRDASR
jgi:hypothetical protein